MKFGVEHSRVLPGSILTASCVELASAWWPFASHESWHCIHEKLASLPWQGWAMPVELAQILAGGSPTGPGA